MKEQDEENPVAQSIEWLKEQGFDQKQAENICRSILAESAEKLWEDPDFDTTQKNPFHNQCAKCGALICATTFRFF